MWICPAYSNKKATYNTLKVGGEVRQIKNNPTVNIIKKTANLLPTVKITGACDPVAELWVFF